MFTWFVAKRLFAEGGSSGRASRLATGIATTGVAIGLAVMLVSVAIVLGFQKEVQDKVLGFGAHIKVLNYKSLSSQELSPIVIDDSLTSRLAAIPNVASVARFCTKPGMLKTDANFRGIAIQGIGQDYDRSFISSHLVKGEMPEFTDTVGSGKLVISQAMAREMQVDVGETIYAYFFEQTVRARKFTVAGIYRTNLTDFDKNFAYTDLYTIHRLLDWDSQQYAGAEIRLQDFDRLNETLHAVVNEVNHKQDAYGEYYSSMSIRMEHPQIFGWLQLLDLHLHVCQRTPHHHPGAHQLHRHHESTRSSQPPDALPLRQLRPAHHRTRHRAGQRTGLRAHPTAEIYRHHYPRSRRLLRRGNARPGELAVGSLHRCRNTHHQCLGYDCAEFRRITHHACQEHPLRIGALPIPPRSPFAAG